MARTIKQNLVLTGLEGTKVTKANIKVLSDGNGVEITIVSELIEEKKKVPAKVKTKTPVPDQVQVPVKENIQNFEDLYPIIDPKDLSGHKFLRHNPKTKWQKNLLEDIRKARKLKIPAFRVACMDPSEKDGDIVYKGGMKPAIGHKFAWWRTAAEEFMIDKNSRIGSELHWAIFLGTIIKYLIDEEGYSVGNAWKAVCDDSSVIGHYADSPDAKFDFEPTGSRKIGKFADLANTCKILKRYESKGIILASGSFASDGNECPLAEIIPIKEKEFEGEDSVAWIIMDV